MRVVIPRQAMPRVSYATWSAMTPAQQAKQRASVSRSTRKPARKPRRKTANLVDDMKGSASSLIKEPWMPIFPATITKRLRYSTAFVLSSVSGAVTGTYVFRANDLYDPDFTGTGHQPMGFDQLMQWYNHFVVTWAKITLVFKNGLATSPTVCLRVDADSTALTVIDRIVEVGGCVHENLEHTGQFGANKTLSMVANIPKLQGVSRAAITANPSLQGSSAASPAELSYFHVSMWDTLGLTGSAIVDVILEQVATFIEPRNMVQS